MRKKIFYQKSTILKNQLNPIPKNSSLNLSKLKKIIKKKVLKNELYKASN